MSASNDFPDYIFHQLSKWGDVTVIRISGGAGLYRGGKMFGLVADDVVYLKGDDTNRDKCILERGITAKTVPRQTNNPVIFLRSPKISWKALKNSLSGLRSLCPSKRNGNDFSNVKKATDERIQQKRRTHS